MSAKLRANNVGEWLQITAESALSLVMYDFPNVISAQEEIERALAGLPVNRPFPPSASDFFRVTPRTGSPTTNS